jgi:Fe-S cluster biogenesis protein NfuA
MGHTSLTIREERERKKEEMLKRIKEIQDRVMPLIENDNGYKADEDIGWKSKLEQKIAKL